MREVPGATVGSFVCAWCHDQIIHDCSVAVLFAVAVAVLGLIEGCCSGDWCHGWSIGLAAVFTSV